MPLYYQPPRLACWGDSLTIGLSSALALTLRSVFQIENYGVGGETSSQILTRFSAASSATKALPTLIWAGRNDFSTPSTVLSNIAAIVAACGPDYLILSVLNAENGSSEYSGGSGYANIQTINSGLASTYGQRYFDLRAFLVKQANARVSQDVTDQGHDLVPSSLRADAVHLTPAGYALAAAEVAKVITGEMFQTTGTVFDLPLYPVTATSGGRIGLGTSSPFTRLHVDQDGGFGSLLLSNYAKHATASLFAGITGQASGIINGDSVGDACLVTNSPNRLRISANNGGATALALRNSDSGVECPAGKLDLGLAKLSQDVDGSGKRRLLVTFPTGAAQVVAAEP